MTVVVLSISVEIFDGPDERLAVIHDGSWAAVSDGFDVHEVVVNVTCFDYVFEGMCFPWVLYFIHVVEKI